MEWNLEVRAISRAVDVLRHIGNVGTGVSLSEIAASVGLSKATTHRVLQTLQAAQFVRCNPLNGYYILGAEFVRLAHGADPYESLKRIARPFLEAIRDETAETVALVVRDHDERLTIEVLLSPQELKAAPAVGSRKPIHAGAAGKALLALATEEELEALAARTGLPRLTGTTLTSLVEIKRELARIRGLGYARSSEEAVEGQCAVGIPIIVGARVIAAINICGPVMRATPERTERMVKKGTAAAKRIAAALAGNAPADKSKSAVPIARAGSPRARPATIR